MLVSPLVVPLEDAWRHVLDGLAGQRRWASSSDVARMGALVRKLSDAYNETGSEPAPLRGTDALAARLAFSFPRDVPKGAAAVRELVATGVLAIPVGRPLRVLDVGAGLGATSRGVVRALATFGAGEVSVDAVDSDSAAVELSRAIVQARSTEGRVSLAWSASCGSVQGRLALRGRYDLVLLGQVLSELDPELPPDERVHKHTELLASLVDVMREDAALVVIEPALRDRTRHLHAVRDALLRGGKVGVFAPCTHDAPCPAIADESAWCHEDVAVDLPGWLVPVARAAGLRFQGLTFSYVVFRRDGRRQRVAVRSIGEPLRVVSGPVVTKGKRELYVCGRFGPDGQVARSKVMRLDRHRTQINEAWDSAARGDLVTASPGLALSKPRVGAETMVERTAWASASIRGLYAIADVTSLVARSLEVLPAVRALLDAAPSAIQIRGKHLPQGEMLTLLRAILPLCRAAGVPLVANDEVEIAAQVGCDYVHVGQEDMPVERVRKLAPGTKIGVSTHSLTQLARALEVRPDYVAYGPVFPTASKQHPDACVGLAGLAEASVMARGAGVPLVAIGGVTRDSAGEVARWADATAVIGALLPHAGGSYAEMTARAVALRTSLTAPQPA